MISSAAVYLAFHSSRSFSSACARIVVSSAVFAGFAPPLNGIFGPKPPKRPPFSGLGASAFSTSGGAAMLADTLLGAMPSASERGAPAEAQGEDVLGRIPYTITGYNRWLDTNGYPAADRSEAD